MTEQTHTPYQRGRRAAERGAPREVPKDIDFGQYRRPWLAGFDSIRGTQRTEIADDTRGEHYRTGQFQAWDVTRYLSGDMAQAWQYVYRCGRKGSDQDAITDLRKAVDFLEDWCANDVPIREVDPDVRHRVNCLLCDHQAVDGWKVPILDRIFMADTYVGQNMAGDRFHGQSLVMAAVIPAITAEIARREAS
ncbi:DUF3310 domain-containing protein [Komagataeibacter diospyri]|uniref:Uncharacterized protein n=1 Tax=Komagataeibacter diospyri TaxID=1932662 RepID=A0A4P5NU22_9PROT|nr:DUF3310 domain-containing protein [Komagataeibacter diospyri]GCE85113.1 hypothetical protein MSKU9_3254 [Komagataeibacter diospyri]